MGGLSLSVDPRRNPTGEDQAPRSILGHVENAGFPGMVGKWRRGDPLDLTGHT
jgi:hypothetical protein